MIGRDLSTHYRLEEQLSAGWLAVTYRARRVEYGSAVAVKLFRAELNTEALQRFDAEASAWDALRHPNIGAIADRGLHAGRPWIASRWLQGEALASRIAGAPLPLTAATTIFRPLMAALASAHAARLVHRNVKPSNVFLERGDTQRRERVQLLDFMPAPKLMQCAAPPARSAYLAPELMAGEAADARSDVFAAGMLLVAMLTGALPDPGDRSEQAFAAPGVSGALLAWIRRATASDPARRFANAGDMLGELIDILPRELRSGQPGGDDPKRSSAAKSQPPPASAPKPARARSATPRTMRASAPPPPTASTSEPPPAADAAPISVPPPPRMPIEARGLVDGPSAQAVPDAPPPAHSPREEGGNSLRPVESPAIAPQLEAWSRLPMAAGAIGALVIAGLTLWQEVRHAERARARVSEPVSARAAPATPPPAPKLQVPPLPAATPPAPEAQPRAAPPPAAPAPKPLPSASVAITTSPPMLAAAPGHPPIRDPWSDPMPAELKRLHELAKRGALADEPKVKALLEYNRDHRDDMRGYLVIGQLYLNRMWRTDCVEEWTTALQRDPGARGAPEILPGLIEIVIQGKAAPIAQALLLKSYGTEALPAIDDALDSVRNPDGATRLFNLRLKITGSPRQE